MKILTFNSHQAYVYLLAKAFGPIDIVESNARYGGKLRWLPRVRPLPPGCRLLGLDEAKENLGVGLYDLAICHNNQDLLDIRDYSLPKMSIFHNTLRGRIVEEGSAIDYNSFRRMVARLHAYWRVKPVFVSSLKRRDWGMKGEVIKLSAPTQECCGYSGEIPKVLRVANYLKERDPLLGFFIQEEILQGLPSDVVGINPSLPGAKPAQSWEALKGMYRRYRLFLVTNREGLEDGYNLATLEAMATGMPVVSTRHPTSPVIDGYNGFISDDLGYLRERVKFLLEDRGEAIKLGRNARKTVLERFSLQDFVKSWHKAVKETLVEYNHKAQEEMVTL